MTPALIFKVEPGESRNRFASLCTSIHPFTEHGGEPLALAWHDGEIRRFVARIEAGHPDILKSGPLAIAPGISVEIGEVDLRHVTPEGRRAGDWRGTASRPGINPLPRLTYGWRQMINNVAAAQEV